MSFGAKIAVLFIVAINVYVIVGIIFFDVDVRKSIVLLTVVLPLLFTGRRS